MNMIWSFASKLARVVRDGGLRSVGERSLDELHVRLRAINARMSPPPKCKVCGEKTRRRKAYWRTFYQCQECFFIFAIDYIPRVLQRGMGMQGSWSGPGGGGFREDYLVRMLIRDLGMARFLLFGTGNTPTFATLRKEGIDAVGCDISSDVVEFKQREFGNNTFFAADTLPAHTRFDGIVAVEVLEHLTAPKETFSMLMSHLKPGGVICGTTNFFLGGTIEDGNDPGYMSNRGHVAYWSSRSLNRIASDYGYVVAEFEMIRPGSVLPDEKYGQLWPNKRVFFVYDPAVHQSYFGNLLKEEPILPIDNP
jgi:SAM-dependent methyltransferase